MGRLMVAGNWKMNGSRSFADELLNELIAGDAIGGVDVVVIPSYVFLAQTEALLEGSSLAWGAQNISEYEEGAYTGEISANMLRDFGCRYVIVGHSERRALFHETNEMVAQKFSKAQSFDITPILCVGETLAERDGQKTLDVIKTQIQAILSLKGGVNVFRKAIIAYEPVWAIGTGLSATPEQAQSVHESIRQQIAEHDTDVASQLRILYGGSVKASNAEALFAMPDIDGALVGGASLTGSEFLNICQAAKRI